MELANKNRLTNDSTAAIFHASAFYEHNLGGQPLVHASHNSPRKIYHYDENQKCVYPEPISPEKASGLTKSLPLGNSSAVSSPSSTNSNKILGFPASAYNLSEEDHSAMNFKPGYASLIHANGTFLSFEQPKNEVRRSLYSKMINKDDEYSIWDDDLNTTSYLNISKSTNTTSHGLPETSSSHDAATQFSWLNDQEENTELGTPVANKNKRPSMGESEQAPKKQCGVASKKPKSSKSVTIAKDPQSIAAKVDLVTMLEKAISYVKFLQLQVKVLATDEFWPTQDGKAPELSQVREAIDAILASQRDRNSSSK
ncbi:DNA binding protein [Dorcoceras hygrometricum]|uniref:DNA binding protein n=1 Tax=Dorcoceras hygrometricum TaxID=472368 RepID=A0A2Z7BX63_9LAMI|nr:DNA binding protein [Dorcoceras hygrometricum]